MFSCPKCDARALVQRTRKVPDGVRRRYYCPDPKCGHRFTTREALSGEDGALLRGLNELMAFDGA